MLKISLIRSSSSTSGGGAVLVELDWEGKGGAGTSACSSLRLDAFVSSSDDTSSIVAEDRTAATAEENGSGA